jgi:site-specific recombinase XerD
MNNLLFKRTKTLDDVIKDFLFARSVERYSPATIRTYTTVLCMFARSAGGTSRFDTIGADMIRKFLAEKSDLSSKTMSNYYIVLASLWTWAVENDYASEHVVNKVRKPKYIKKQVLPYTENEVRKIYRSCRDWRERAIVMVLIDCGIRASELANLTVDDWSPGMLTIQNGKGGKSRCVPISEATESAIFRSLCKRIINEKGLGGGISLFSSQYPTLPLSYEAVRDLMHRLGDRSSIPNVHAHRFRHTFAITFLRNGGDIYTLKRILGHSSLEMVQHYLDIATSDVISMHQKASPIIIWNLGGY